MKCGRLFKLFIFSIVLTISSSLWAAGVKRYYCEMNYSWWTTGDATGNASVGAYMWDNDNTSINNTWPGVKMKWTGLAGIWYVDIDTDTYDRVVFTRLNSAGDTYWGFKTNDITLGDANYYTITQSSKPNSEICTSSDHYYRYLDGNEPIYIKNVKPMKSSDKNQRWDKPYCDNSTGNRVYAYFCNGSSPATYIELTSDEVVEGTHQAENAIYSVKPVQGFYQNIIVVRKSSVGWGSNFNDNLWNKTGDIPIPTTNTDNLLADFQETYTEHSWSLIKHKVFSDSPVYMYYDNSNTSWTSTIQFVIGRDGFTRAYPMGNITGTKLYYVDLNTVSNIKWEDATYYAVMQKDNANITTSAGHSDGYAWAKSQADHYTSDYSTKYLWAYELDANQTYLATTTNGNDGTEWTITWKGESSTSDYTYIEKYNHTVNVYTKTGTTYGTANNSPATVTVQGYEMTGNGAATQQTGTVTKNSAQTVTLNDIVSTSQLDYAYASLDASWHFDGWAEVSSGPTSLENTYRINCAKSAQTVYAYFSKEYAVSFDLQGHGSAIAGQTILAGGTVSRPADPTAAGYIFNGWYKEEACTNAWDFANDVVTETTTLFARWTEKTMTFSATTDGNWSTATNWTDNVLPTIDHDVVIAKPVTVDVQTARAKSVAIYNDGSSHAGKLSIAAGKELVVATTVRKTTDGLTSGPTDEGDIFFDSNPTLGLGALVMGSHDGTNKATVNFFSKSHGEATPEESVSQYLGVPFSDATVLSAYYNSWVYRIDYLDDGGGIGNMYWVQMAGNEAMTPHRGYAVCSAESEVQPGGVTGHYYWMQGTLVPSKDTTRYLFFYGTPVTNPNNENLLANSWMAPIKINAFDPETDFDGADATIYIFNAGSYNDYISHYGEIEIIPGEPEGGSSAEGPFANNPGQYETYTVGTAGDAVIPAMNSFSIYTNTLKIEPGCFIKMNYNRLVYEPALESTRPVANKAPRRAKVKLDETEQMYVYVQAESRLGDKLRILAHADFEEGFENGWDGHKIIGESFAPQLYAKTSDGNMAVNCVPTFEGSVLGFLPSDKDSIYTFYFSYDGDETLYLNDLKEEKSTLINGENTYQFFSKDGAFEARFVISAMPFGSSDVAAGTVSAEALPVSGARKIMIDNKLFIIRNGRMYDAAGVTVK